MPNNLNAITVSICFTNFGPYHLARLRALARSLHDRGGRLIGFELAGEERLYPWTTSRADEPFEWVTLFPDDAVESIPPAACVDAIEAALERSRPDVVGIVGYARPESTAALRWARRRGKVAILLSESQAVDRPRVWWKEALKARRVRRFDAALVGGPTHRDYLVGLGMPSSRVALGYNVVDHDFFAARARSARSLDDRAGIPDKPYFLSVSRFASEKNLLTLIDAYAAYRRSVGREDSWRLVLCGDGPERPAIEAVIDRAGCRESIVLPGFLQADALTRWYAFASAFVLASRSEPWGLVVNEAAAAALPLLISDRAGCAGTLVVEAGENQTGRRFDPTRAASIADALAWMSSLTAEQRLILGQNAERVASSWGPARFASGMLEAVARARRSAVEDVPALSCT
ncbi:MAG: glycosyltransferase family 4 protein [Planctomycetota bacterium]|nr:glycosyltransferase family 4 protein [Planctomycetota bacterium]